MRPGLGAARGGEAGPGPLKPSVSKTQMGGSRKKKKMAKQLQRLAEEEEAAALEVEEAERRGRHLQALSGATGAERELEELLFGDCLAAEEGELLQRLAGPPRVGPGGGRELRRRHLAACGYPPRGGGRPAAGLKGAARLFSARCRGGREPSQRLQRFGGGE